MRTENNPRRHSELETRIGKAKSFPADGRASEGKRREGVGEKETTGKEDEEESGVGRIEGGATERGWQGETDLVQATCPFPDTTRPLVGIQSNLQSFRPTGELPSTSLFLLRCECYPELTAKVNSPSTPVDRGQQSLETITTTRRREHGREAFLPPCLFVLFREREKERESAAKRKLLGEEGRRNRA